MIRSATRFVESVVQPDDFGDHVRPTWYLRKGGGDFGSYLGARPRLVKAGVYREVILSLTDITWIDDVRVRPELEADRTALSVDVECGGRDGALLRWQLLDPDGVVVADGERDCSSRSWTVTVPDPRLWWPRGHGEQALYRLITELVATDGQELDRQEVEVGLREVTLVTTEPDDKTPCFRLVVNGRPIVVRGANWAQVEGITNVWQHERAIRLLDLAEQAEMNLLRVWGGGVIPEPDFYSECDRRGFLVWQDFMFEYGMYPTDLPHFEAVVERELIDVVRRLRNHACIALWCGGNESHMGWDFQYHTPPAIGTALFDVLMPRVCAEHDGTRAFHPNSPYGGPVANWPLAGDWHDYTTLTYAHRSAVPTFISEMGRVSAPNLRSMRRFLQPQDLWPDDHDPTIQCPGEPSWPPMWGYRAPDGAWQKIGPIEQYLEPRDADGFIRALGTAHGEYLQASVERHRRGVADGELRGAGPERKARRRNGGDLVWRLNDPWPIPYWSVVDSYLEPKIPYFYLRRAYAPLLISFEQTVDELAVWITNDTAESIAGELVVRRVRFDGSIVGELRETATVAPAESIRLVETAALLPIGLRNELLVAEFAGRTTNHLLIGERYLELPPAGLRAHVEGDMLHLTADAFARQVIIDWPDELDGLRVEDNYVDLLPGCEHRIRLVDRPHLDSYLTIRALNAQAVTVPVPADLPRT
ncbi:glycoside hydrolase family 2 protein [Microlunatus sp. Gsoil 973]|uniref:glycoside hydrolase family 2 protein n=1 Tax=Microlunatus sp. Gsoil 973 TaxID=2672569 RepID=UPI0012B4CAD3|nr:glycoside hydrolase family 2 protein [Microlunatus sp. Gsoil 973]QGN34065.1 hypothetical protein GJV80_15965 [Microlunatus sp. Gsoil 973]